MYRESDKREQFYRVQNIPYYIRTWKKVVRMPLFVNMSTLNVPGKIWILGKEVGIVSISN